MDSLKSGKAVLNTLMKHVKLADREELGWNVVKHYDSDDLLSRSDDEKALGRARRLAAAEVKKTSAVAAAPTSKFLWGALKNFRILGGTFFIFFYIFPMRTFGT